MPSPPKVVRLDEVRRAALAPPPPPARPQADDAEELVLGLREGKRWASRALLERYGGHVERVLTHILGSHAELDDLTQEVFVRALARVGELRDPRALKDWLASFAANVAREAIRRRRRRWWQVLRPPDETPELEAPSASAEDRAALRAFYEVLEGLDADARVAFALRYVEGMELIQVADACGVSLATVKRRIKGAEAEFCARGRAREALASWFEEGTRWRHQTS
jgi:RNA polymerase sigma-70 factor (ECF subfamily)